MSDAALSAPDKDARITELEAALATARADISARDILIDTLRVQLARLKRMQFGKASEKLSHEIAQLELALEELEAEAATVSARRVDPARLDRPAPVRALPDHLPREEQRIEPEFDHHLPLYRQAEMMAAQGIDIDRSTLAGWAGQAAALLDPIVSRIRDVGLTAAKIHTDDTPVPMLDPGRGKTATGRIWAYVVDDRGAGATTPPLVWYQFTQDRTGSHPQQQLASFTGFLQADGYAGYDKLYTTNRVTEVACWAHFRRKIFDIHATKPTSLTTDLLARIAALYRIEDEIRGHPPDVRQRGRLERTAPLVEALRTALDDALRRLSPKSEMAKAITYGRKRWTALTRFLDDGRLEIDNNIAERAIRSIAIGRKNWLFAGSKAGGERAAAIYTVIETCKLNGIEPQAYIADVIAKIAGNWPAARWDELMPWNWRPEVQTIAEAA